MIPLNTTTITVYRSNQDGTKDAGEVTYLPLHAGVRAVIGGHTGNELATSGSSEHVSARLDCDPIDLRHDDHVHDDRTGERWLVSWTRRRLGFGIDHTVAELYVITDRAGVGGQGGVSAGG